MYSIICFQNRRLASSQKSEGIGPLEPDRGRVVEEESGGRSSSPSHDLGRDDFNHGNS